MTNELLPSPSVQLVRASGVQNLLSQIRPQWQSKKLIERVRKLLDVDPSSACQRLLNAAIHDLREKIAIAGLDIAGEVARQYKLPTITNAEDIANYSNSRLIELAYRMGLLSRPEWRRVLRCYEIRRDLEHEDHEYEAGVEDCVYIFVTCIEVILSREPVQLLKVTDFKDLIEQASAIVPNKVVLEDFKNAPQPRQEEILKFLISHAMDKSKSDIIQQNAYNCIKFLKSLTRQTVQVSIGEHIQSVAGRRIDARTARVAEAAGVFPYLRQAARVDFFSKYYKKMKQVGTRWAGHNEHGELLRSFIEYGGIDNCPDVIRKKILTWLVLTYIGEPGGRTQYGNLRNVYYSNTAAPLIEEILFLSSIDLRQELEEIRCEKEVKLAICTDHIAGRFDRLADIVGKDLT